MRLVLRVCLLIVFFVFWGCADVYAQPCAPVVSIAVSPNDTVCTGNAVTFTATLTSGGSTHTYHWYKNGVVVSAAGSTYIDTPVNGDSIRCVVTTSGPPCSSPAVAVSNTIRMTVNTIAPIGGPPVVCVTNPVFYTHIVSGGRWSSSSTAVALIGSVSGVLTPVSGGAVTITYALPSGCSVTKSLTIDPLPDAGVIQNDGANAFCLGDTWHVWDTTAGGVWSIANTNATLSGSTLTAVTPGPDTVFYRITNTCGADTAIFPFAVAPPLPPITGQHTLCVGDTVTLSNAVGGGMWSETSSAVQVWVSLPGPGMVLGLSAGTAVITYEMDLGCSTTTTVTVNPLPAAGTISGPDTVCVNALFLLSCSVPGGTWSSGAPPVATVHVDSGRVHSISQGVVNITYTTTPNSYGCIAYATHKVTVTNDYLSATESITPIKCYGETGTIAVTVNGGTPPFQYRWSGGGNTSVATGLVAGTHTLTVTETATQCVYTDTFSLVAPDALAVMTETGKDVCKSKAGSVKATATGGTPAYQYLWSTNSTGSEITGLTADTYSVTVTDAEGCTITTAAIVEDSCTGVIVCTALSPNGDGINDTWIIDGIQLHPNKVQVFNKMGDLVFERSNYTNDWSGTGSNGELPDGTYYYIVKLNGGNVPAGSDLFTGSLLIKR